MPLFRDSRPDDLLIRYLLGALPDAETERLDEQSLADDDFADRLRAAEDDLIDAYVSGTLTGERRERFESNYLASPRRRDKVAFARRFLAVVDRSSSPLHVVAAARTPAVPEPRRAWTFRMVLAAAAGLMITSSVLLTN
jgi:anti-sigma factor RsiW